MRGCILGEFEFIAIQNLSMFNPRLERGEIRRGKVAARVNFVALPPFEIAHCSFSPVHSRLSAFSFQRYFIGARMFAFPREKLIRAGKFSRDTTLRTSVEFFPSPRVSQIRTFKLKTIVERSFSLIDST